MVASNGSALPAATSKWARWRQLVLGIICLVMIANLQYGWTLFIDPIDAKYHWGRAAIQVAFTIFIVTGDLGCSRRRLPSRSFWPEDSGLHEWSAGRGSLGYQLDRGQLDTHLHRRRHCGPWRGSDLRGDCKQRREVVPGPTGPGDGIDGGRLWSRLSPDGCTPWQPDPGKRLMRRPFYGSALGRASSSWLPRSCCELRNQAST